MSKAISKELWQDIETEMTAMFVNITFTYKGYELSVRRERVGESKTALFVYIDGVMKAKWMHLKDLVDDDAPAILNDVWCQKSKAVYSAKDIAAIEKIWGKRRAKEQHPRLHEKLVWHEPCFTKASVLCRKFKKLEGLELIHAACMQYSNPTG
ncbi:hypothetical protein [Shewanella sp. MSW]|uniref:hypothetical protein n=1 Tax=Shewanella sp. MSW TaxID=2569536 RepID=UPI0011854331|nr:hypothetical protein [Shewanella sp. MSW]TVP12510.1 hypothetical protein AYI96_05640 [Shewanella sp. MSW]